MTILNPAPSSASGNTDLSGRPTLASLRFESIKVMSAYLEDGSISAVELCRAILATIHALDGSLGAYSAVLAETAICEAAAADGRRKAGNRLGPLDGIPIAVKDLIDTRDAVCKAGLDHLASYVPAADAGVVAALRRAGAVIIGVTETDPGAFSTDTPQTVNPLDPRRTVGGSSGGSAAVVAAGLAAGAIGTDTGGSIRIPAACCSIFGFKPSWGRVDVTGVRPLAPSLDHVGALTRSVGDLKLIQSVLDPSLGAHSPCDRPLVFGSCPAYFEDAAPEVTAAVFTTLDTLQSHGAMVREVTLPAPADVLAFHMVNLAKEAADYHTQQFPQAWPAYPEIARATVEAGRMTSSADYAWSEERRHAAALAVDLALADVDAIVLPTLPTDAPPRELTQVRLGQTTVTKLEATIRYTALFNQTGHPVVALPATLLADERALGIQLVGKRDRDADLLALAERVEQMLAIHVDYARLVERQAGNARRVRAEIA